MSKIVKIDIPNSNGKTAIITFRPFTGGVIYLGPQILPYYYTTDNPYGIYEVVIDGVTCNQILNPPPTPTPTPTPTRIVVTPTPTPTAYCDDTEVFVSNCQNCTIYPLPPDRVYTSVTYNDLIISTEYTGPVTGYEALGSTPGTFNTCCNFNMPYDTCNVGYNVGNFEYKIYFNKLVNDIILVSAGGGSYSNTSGSESFTFTTNVSNPTLIPCNDSCGAKFQNNVYSTTVSGLTFPNDGCAYFKVHNNTSYSAITISGNGGLDGSRFAICLGGAVSGCTDCFGNFNYELNNGKCEGKLEYEALPPAILVNSIPTGSTRYTTGGTNFWRLNTNTFYHEFDQTLTTDNIWSNNSPTSFLKGPFNRTAIKNNPSFDSDVANRYYGFNISIPCLFSGYTKNRFCIGIAADQHFRFLEDGEIALDSETGQGLFNVTDPTGTWTVFEYFSFALDFITSFQILGYNKGSFGFEIYGNTLDELKNATDISQINILKSSRDFTELEIITEYDETPVSFGYTCPKGGEYNSCLKKCVNESIRCFPTESNCPPCGLIGFPFKKIPVVKFGDVEVTYTYQAPSPLNAGPQLVIPNCLFSRVPKKSVLFGGRDPRPFIYTLYFSKPINNLRLTFFGGGAVEYPGVNEEYVIDTNGGVPQLNMCDSCYTIISGNTVYTTHGGIDPFVNMGCGVFEVNAPFEYTELSVAGPGPIPLAGTSWYLCVDPTDIPPAPTPKPPPPNVFGPDTYTAFMKFNVVGAPVPTPVPISVNTVYTRYNIY